ncbi:M48 family metallopeptidase [Gemmobacter lanyuensis]
MVAAGRAAAGPPLGAVMITAALAGCVQMPGAGMAPTAAIMRPAPPANSFVEVVERVEPVAEGMCRASAPRGVNCDLEIMVDPRPDQQPNAFQTVDDRGRPVVVFTLTLIAAAQNADEIAFVLGHEAAHHIAGHIPRRQQTAAEGAMLGAVFAEATGADQATMAQLQRMGAELGARRFSKEFELEADALGAEITWRAGFDPVRGTGFFDRLPDPGDQFLGSHPANAQRRAQVAAVVAQLEGWPAY